MGIGCANSYQLPLISVIIETPASEKEKAMTLRERYLKGHITQEEYMRELQQRNAERAAFWKEQGFILGLLEGEC